MPNLDDELAELEKRIRQLKIEYDIFLVGGKKTPPRLLQNAVESMTQRLLEEKRWTFSQKFKFQTLVARYSSYRELWRKKLQDKEEKGRLRDEEELQRMVEHGLTAVSPDGKPDRFVYVTEDPARETDQVAAMYAFLQEAHQKVGSSNFNMDIAKFHLFLQNKTHEIKAKTNCKAVEFQVKLDRAAGRVKLSAKTKK
jgi:hypothetical protein